MDRYLTGEFPKEMRVPRPGPDRRPRKPLQSVVNIEPRFELSSCIFGDKSISLILFSFRTIQDPKLEDSSSLRQGSGVSDRASNQCVHETRRAKSPNRDTFDVYSSQNMSENIVASTGGCQSRYEQGSETIFPEIEVSRKLHSTACVCHTYAVKLGR